MTDNRLLCTHCDSLVYVAGGYDGYHGTCECDSYYFRVRSGDPPLGWTTISDATSPEKFHFWREGHIRGQKEIIEEDHVECSVCNSVDSVTIEIEAVDVDRFDMKVTFRCTADHYHNDRTVESVAYYRRDGPGGQALAEVADSDDVRTDGGRPLDSAVYRHTGTDDEVRYVCRDDGAYRFSINGGERTLTIPTEDWPDYSEFLEIEGHA